MGVLIAVEERSDGKVRRLVIKFDHPDTGVAARENFPFIKKKYPGGTIITPKEMEYSLARTKSLVSSTAHLVQYTVIPAFAVTGENYEGNKVILINLHLIVFLKLCKIG